MTNSSGKPAAPAITGLSPAAGPPGGSTIVTITGTAFAGASIVRFGSFSAPFLVVSATQIDALCPPGSSGRVEVTTPGGTASLQMDSAAQSGVVARWGERLDNYFRFRESIDYWSVTFGFYCPIAVFQGLSCLTAGYFCPTSQVGQFQAAGWGLIVLPLIGFVYLLAPALNYDWTQPPKPDDRVKTDGTRLKFFFASAIFLSCLALGLCLLAPVPAQCLTLLGLVFLAAGFALFLLYRMGRQETYFQAGEIQRVQNEIDVDSIPDLPTKRANRLFRANQFEVKRYYDESLSQIQNLLWAGIGSILVSMGIVVYAVYNPAGFRDGAASLPYISSIITAVLGTVFLGMYKGALETVLQLHQRQVRTHHMLLANLLVKESADADQVRQTVDVMGAVQQEISPAKPLDMTIPPLPAQPSLPATPLPSLPSTPLPLDIGNFSRTKESGKVVLSFKLSRALQSNEDTTFSYKEVPDGAPVTSPVTISGTDAKVVLSGLELNKPYEGTLTATASGLPQKAKTVKFSDSDA